MLYKNRQYRSFDFESDKEAQKVEGYAAVFGVPTLIDCRKGVNYYEVIEQGAFDGVDFSNVIMNCDHGGKIVARTKNGTLILSVDNIGLKIIAYLSGTSAGRELYVEIDGGYFDKMSFCFDADESELKFDSTNTRHIRHITALYDVSVVSFPAYEQTCVYARDSVSTALELRQQNINKRNKLKLLLNLRRKKK